MSIDFDRIKNLREFTVVRDVPGGFVFRGKIPYDLTMDESEIKIKVWAATEQEANARADEFIEKSTEDE